MLSGVNMKSIGLDIGTTTVCGIVVDVSNGTVLEALTLANDSGIATESEFARLQDAKRIMSICEQIVNGMIEKYNDVVAIGVTGQMHGIVYLDAEGNAVSPLYSWQDERGNQQYQNGQTYSEYLSAATGYQMATGYGLTTHFYNEVNKLIPAMAVCFCTIADYVAMHLAESKKPIMHKSMAASMGMFNVEMGNFDMAAIAKTEMEQKYFPSVSNEENIYGKNARGISVSIALGDNQASFLGSVSGDSNILVNVGTGSQISVFTERFDKAIKVEYRPFIGDTFLMVGAPLCGGSAYAMLKNFFENVLKMFGCEVPDHFYEIMNQAADSVYDQEDSLVADTRFNGTRADPTWRGSIGQIGGKNGNPEALTLAVLRGICGELFDIFEQMPEQDKSFDVIIGSGNGIRQNPVLQRIVADTFARSLVIPEFSEEASYGAALHGLYCSGKIPDLDSVKEMIRAKVVVNNSD